MKLIDQLKELIKEESDKLVCETHPEVCSMRDSSYDKLERLVLEIIFADTTPVSVQTALAFLEQELTDDLTN